MHAKRRCSQVVKLGLLVCMTLALSSHNAKSVPMRAKDVSAAQKRQAYRWALKAFQSYHAHNYRLAVSYSLKATAIDPTNSLYFFNLGDCYWRLNNLQAAVQAYQKSLVLRPHEPKTLTNLGIALVLLQRFSEAIPPLQEANHSKLSSDGFRYLGIALSHFGRYTEAAEAYKQYTNLEPHDARGFLDLGKALRLSRHSKQAIQAFEQYTKLKPGDPIGYLYLGQAFYYTKQNAKAKQNFDKYTKGRPRDTSGFVWLGNALFKLQRRNEAAKAYKEALRLDPSNKYALRNLKFLTKKK